MKKDKIIYWSTTVIVSVMMLFSAYMYLTAPAMEAAFKHLGFPDWFRTELALAKIAGAVVLLAPQISIRIKEWAYTGFAIVFISAFIAHVQRGDPVSMAAAPVVFLLLLVVSNIYLQKTLAVTSQLQHTDLQILKNKKVPAA